MLAMRTCRFCGYMASPPVCTKCGKAYPANTTVAIVGKAQKTCVYAPYDNLGIDIWVYNDFAFKHASRVSAMFEMHMDAADRPERYSAEYSDWLRQPHNFPIWMHAPDPRVPASVRYPREEISERFLRHVWRGPDQVQNFFTSSTPYALALALFLGYERIDLYGIELSSTPEYTAERDCVFFWEGVANALGVDVVVHPLTNLYDAQIYGL